MDVDRHAPDLTPLRQDFDQARWVAIQPILLFEQERDWFDSARLDPGVDQLAPRVHLKRVRWIAVGHARRELFLGVHARATFDGRVDDADAVVIALEMIEQREQPFRLAARRPPAENLELALV